MGNNTEIENYLNEIGLNHSNLRDASWKTLTEHRRSLDATSALDQMRLTMSALFKIRRNIRDLQEDQADANINDTALKRLDTLINQLVDQQIELIKGFLDEFDQSLQETLQPVVDKITDNKLKAVDKLKARFTFNN